MEWTPAQWSKIKHLFEAAANREPAARSSFIADNCPEGSLRAEVEKLLANYEEMGDFLATPQPGGSTNPSTNPEHHGFTANHVLAGRFRITRFIAQGGMGEVYEAEDLELESLVAVKTIRPAIMNSSMVARLKREVQLAKQVTHPNVCRIYDVFRHTSTWRQDDGAVKSLDTLFISMEFLSGETLAHHLQSVGRMSLQETLPIIFQILEGLHAAHTAGILHRDLKPENVMLVPLPGPGAYRAVVTDFGLALGYASLERISEMKVGTPAYMAPEQLEGGELTPASDVYSLGLIMYRMTAGKSAFEVVSTAARLPKPLPGERAPSKGIVGGLEREWHRVIFKCLERSPSGRLQSAAQVAQELTRTAAGKRHRFNAGIHAIAEDSQSSRYIGLALLAMLLCVPYITPHSRPRAVSIRGLTESTLKKSGPLVVHGGYLFYREKYGRDWRTVKLALAEAHGFSTPVPLPFGYVVDATPTALVLCDKSQLWTLADAERKPEPVMHSASCLSSVSPVNGEIADVADDGVHVLDRPSRTAQVWSIAEAGHGSPSWSPDGKHLRVTRKDSPQQTSIWEADAAGRFRCLITANDALPKAFDGTWTRDGRYFIFQATSSINVSLWYRHESDGALGQLTDDSMSWSSPVPGDKADLLYALGGSERRALMHVDLNTGKLEPCFEGSPYTDIDYSRNGRSMIYSVLPERGLRMRTELSDRSLTVNEIEAHGAHFSPDGREIAFMGRKGQGPFRIHMIPASGGMSHELLEGTEDQGIPTWSADGRYLVFGDLYDLKHPNAMTLHLYDRSSQVLSELPDSQGLWSPRWSPDGRYIAAVTTDEKTLKLFDVRQSKWTEIARFPYFENPAWTPDSAYIYGDGREPGGPFKVYRTRVKDRKADVIADLGENGAGGWVGAAPDGSPLVLQFIHAQDIYELKLSLP